MDISPPALVFISYSHDSTAHEQRVLAFSDRLRADGVNASLDQYESDPPTGWPIWMEDQIRDADFVLLVCSEAYRRRVERREEPGKGQGVVWESLIIYNELYSDTGVNRKFIAVLLEGASPNDIPLPLRGFTYYRADTEAGYENLYRRLTKQPAVTKPALGHLKSLPPKEKSEHSLPTAFSLEQLSKTMSNPKYAEDLFKLDRIYDTHAIINRETIVVVVGIKIVAELLDRSVAELLRNHIDQRGGLFPFRRGIIITDQAWYAETALIGNSPVIAVGGPPVNKLAAEFDQWVPTPPSSGGKYAIPGGARTGFFRRNQAGLPQVGLWGRYANDTREAVEHYLKAEQGLTEFLKMCWK